MSYIALSLIAFLGFFVKAVSGFGPAIVVVAFGSLLLPPHVVVPLSALLDMTAGGILFCMDPAMEERRYWIPLAAAIVAGSVLGSLFLAVVPPEIFRIVLAVAIVVLGFWFLFMRTRGEEGSLSPVIPARATGPDLAFCAAGGLLGGFLGISGPPILWHFGRKLAKFPLRRLLIPVFFAAAIARVATYTGTDLIGARVLTAYAASVPGLLLGIVVGNRFFFRISEKVFSRIVGTVLVVTGIRLLV